MVDVLSSSEMFWLSTVRADGRPHVTPLPAIWHAGRLHICTGAHEQKAKNLLADPRCVLTTGTNTLRDGLDVVVEGTAVRVTDRQSLEELAALWLSKLDWPFEVGDGAFRDGAGRDGLVFGDRRRQGPRVRQESLHPDPLPARVALGRFFELIGPGSGADPAGCEPTAPAAPGLRSPDSVRRFSVLRQLVQQVLHHPAHVVEMRSAHGCPPVLLDLGDPITGVAESLPSARCRKDQLRPPVGGIRSALEIAELLQIADQLRGGAEAQLRSGCQLGQPDTIDADIAEDVQVRFADVGVAVLVRRREQFDAELSQQPAQELADRQAVGRQIS